MGCIILISAPAIKALSPEPVRIITPTEESFIQFTIASSSSEMIIGFIALRASGRSMVTQAI
ncbi:hypothetical protein OAD01_04120 [Candidatus Marinimicrobia bacterium]|nr:hypothetical protein [Candidatus Neomarinimicrobiota bacterium]